MQLPIEKVKAGIRVLAEKKNSSLDNGTDAARAIMTTDTCEKELAAIIKVGEKTVTIGGMAKGSGHDPSKYVHHAGVYHHRCGNRKDTLQKALSEDVRDTYNMISVDGDTSTNDTVLLLANGMAENVMIQYGTPEYEEFVKALHVVNEYLAKKIAGDGEGATALFEVKAAGCESVEQAKTLAKAIVCSNLTKTAIAGHDANWGRILCAMGYSGAWFDPEKVDLFFESEAGKIKIIENGTAVAYSEEEATKSCLRKK